MRKQGKTMAQRIDGMAISETISIRLADYKYTSIQVALSQRRLAGFDYISSLTEKRNAVQITRIK